MVEDPWLLIGDFNCKLRAKERSTMGGTSSCFQNWVMSRALIDLGFIGPPFTWSHGKTVETRRAARLDRGLCDDGWRHLFPNACVKHLPHVWSDHCPILLHLGGTPSTGLGERPFKFQAAWLLHNNFDEWMRENWMTKVDLPEALKDFSCKLRAWNRDTFENIFKRKKREEIRLTGVARALSNKMNTCLLHLEAELKEERRILLLQEEILWRQKSRAEWLKSGDDNTKYFHTTTLIRRRRNNVEALINDDGL